MRIFKGYRNGDDDYVAQTRVWAEEDGSSRNITPDFSLTIRNHSPTGFNWGYGGSGPTQLALALLLEVSHSRDLAEKHYHDFKNTFVARWNDQWEINEKEILAWLVEKEKNNV
jgi:hypothetical protein